MLSAMATSTRAERIAAQRRCDRILSGTRPSSMREQLAALTAAVEPDALPDFYGTDGPVAALERRIAALLGTEAAVFFITGTMAQQVAVRYGADLTGRRAAALHPMGHQEADELNAIADLTGLRPVWPTTEPRNPTAAEITGLAEPVGTIVLELPLRRAGFVLPTWDELTAATSAARAAGARVHLDGARMWESAPYLGHSHAEIAALADSTYVSFYKALGAPAGAALAGDAALASYARSWRQRHGGQVFQQWPYAVAALTALDDTLPRLPAWVAQARTVATALATLPGARVFPDPPHTQDLVLYLPHPADRLIEANLALATEEKTWFIGGWEDTDIPGIARAEVRVMEPATTWTPDEITEAGHRFLHHATRPAG